VLTALIALIRDMPLKCVKHPDPPIQSVNYLSEAPQAAPQAAGFSSGLSEAPQAVPHAAGFSSGLSAPPQAVPHAAVAAFSFSFHPAMLDNAMSFPP
jgi:hypothetical protein